MTGTGVPQDSWAEVGDLTMRYMDWGGDGPPVMALHGLASSGHWYDLVAPNLRERFRIISPDQRGHGRTTQANTGYDWETLAGDVARLMDHLGIEKASVFGTFMGWPCGQQSGCPPSSPRPWRGAHRRWLSGRYNASWRHLGSLQQPGPSSRRFGRQRAVFGPAA